MTIEHPRLGHNLRQLIALQPSPLVSVEELTRLRSAVQRRASFRLVFEDGTVVKGRRFRTLERRQMATALLPLAAGLPLNPVLDSLGDSWLEQWIEGTPLRSGDTTESLCRWAGDVLGQLHGRAVNGVDTVPPAQGVDTILVQLANNLDRIVALGGLDRSTADSLQAIAKTERPAAPDTGLIHTDFSVENFVSRPDGDLIVIDNEHLMLGALDYDLVKSFCRWPMNEAQQSAFCEGYGHHRDPAPALSGRVFWAIFALAQSARVQLRHRGLHQHLLLSLTKLAGGEREEIWPTPP